MRHNFHDSQHIRRLSVPAQRQFIREILKRDHEIEQRVNYVGRIEEAGR